MGLRNFLSLGMTFSFILLLFEALKFENNGDLDQTIEAKLEFTCSSTTFVNEVLAKDERIRR